MDKIDILTIGEALVDMISTVKGISIEEATGFHKAFGGAVANVAVGCARLGARTAFIGKVGDDPFGRFLHDTMKKMGVITDGVVFSTEHDTSLVLVSLDMNSKPTFYFYGRPAADLNLKPEEIRLDLIENTRFIHFGTVSLSAEPCRSATVKAVKTARDAGAIVSYDPNVRFHMWPGREEAIEWARKMIPQSDIIKVNDDEAEWLVGTRKPKEAAKKFLAMGPKLVLITLGERGAFFATCKATGHVSAIPVIVVDTTGAGDAFVAGLLTGLAQYGTRNMEDVQMIRRVVTRAVATAALTTEAMGAISAMPDKETLEKAMKERFGLGELP